MGQSPLKGQQFKRYYKVYKKTEAKSTTKHGQHTIQQRKKTPKKRLPGICYHSTGYTHHKPNFLKLVYHQEDFQL